MTVGCPAGFYIDAGNSNACTACEVNQYNDQEDQSSCSPCTGGQTTNGQTGQTACGKTLHTGRGKEGGAMVIW